MTPPQKMANMGKILVAGANGALGQTLIGLLGPDVAVAGTRRQNWDDVLFDHVSLENDEAINAVDWRKFRAVINVVERVKGSIDQLTDAHVSFPVKLAQSAREGNLKQFVQVSSFAVYGFAEYIDDNTREAPTTPYGHTKAEGDRQLHALAADGFSIASLRLPFLFDVERPALFRPLLNAIRMLPYFPVASKPVKRSMITYYDAARAIRKLVESPRLGVFHAAAPTLFDFEMLDRLLYEELGVHMRTVRLPDAITSAIKFGAPPLHRRLFQSNVLDPRVNMSADIEEINDMEAALRSLIRNYFL